MTLQSLQRGYQLHGNKAMTISNDSLNNFKFTELLINKKNNQIRENWLSLSVHDLIPAGHFISGIPKDDKWLDFE